MTPDAIRQEYKERKEAAYHMFLDPDLDMIAEMIADDAGITLADVQRAINEGEKE